ncbi:MAG: prepilin-type N-terminal cleavage/methylation domain-containing protein [Alphaproteobacteria bacterium]|nr:prepilin-type N-terminal cleavage/methylation domain-containing protein [Alphaproteobacteria bacterium]
MIRGFSLVELSIVLVILGLLTGGILAGQSLIRASELRAVSSEYQRYAASIATFRDKYFGLPGDFRDATKFWGAAHATPATCAVTQGTGTQTCDGDGDGTIEHETSFTGSSEQFRFWQQLANAGLIEGNYTGAKGSVGNIDHAILGTNVPRSKLTNAGWGMRLFGSIGFMTNTQVLMFGASQTNNMPFGYALKPEEAWNIDTKMDDGRPAYGSVVATEANLTCNTTAVASTAEYLLSASAVGCSLSFKAFQ